MQLLPDERVLMESNGRILVLTTHRVRYGWESNTGGDLVSIMLEQVASCTVTHHANVPLLIWGIVLTILGGLGILIGVNLRGTTDAGTIGGVIALIGAGLIIAYFTARFLHLEIASTGGQVIRLHLSHGKADSIRELIDELERAKDARYRSRPAVGYTGG